MKRFSSKSKDKKNLSQMHGGFENLKHKLLPKEWSRIKLPFRRLS
jgi:hypothetical protein